MHAHACDVAFMQTLEWMLAMVIKSGCILRSPVILVTGTLSDVLGEYQVSEELSHNF